MDFYMHPCGTGPAIFTFDDKNAIFTQVFTLLFRLNKASDLFQFGASQ